MCVCVFSIPIHSSQPIWTKLGTKHPWGQGRARSCCRCIRLNCAAAVEPEKMEVPISRQLLYRFGPKLVCGCMYYVQVSIFKVAMMEACSTEPCRKNRKCPYLRNRWTDFNETCRVDVYSMQKCHSKKSGPLRCAAPSYCPFFWKC